MRWVLCLTVMLGLGLGATWLLRPSAAAPLPFAEDPALGDAYGGTGFADSNLVPSEIDDRGPTDADASDGARAHERLDGAPTATGPLGPSVLVLQGEPAAPVVNAKVCFFDDAKYRRMSRSAQQGTSKYAAPESFGEVVRTDQNGRAQLPGGSGRWLCTAQHKQWFGFLEFAKAIGDHTITLREDEQVVLVVQSSAEAPPRSMEDIPLAVMQAYKRGRSAEIWRGETDERGRAVVPHLQYLRRPVEKNQQEDFKEQFAAVVRVPSKPVMMTEFAGRPTNGEPVAIALPPLGTVQAQLVDHSGRPLLSPAKIGYSTKGLSSQSFPISSSSFALTVEKPAGDAPVELPYARLDSEIQIYARYPHDRRSTYSDKVQGPADPAEPAVIKIKPLPRHCVVGGRFVLADGQPLDAGAVTVVIWRNDKVSIRASAQTIASGHWDLVLSPPTTKAQWRMECRHQQTEQSEQGDDASEDPRPNPWLGAIIDLSQWQQGTRHDLGEIVLRELPLLAAGVVVDDQGLPVAGATVTIQQEGTGRFGSRFGSRSSSNGPQSINIGWFNNAEVTSNFSSNSWSSSRQPKKAKPIFYNLRHLRATTSLSGAFAIYAPKPAGNLRVQAIAREHFSGNAPLPAPAQNVRLTIPRNGWLKGQALLPDWIPEGSVTIKLRPVEESRRRRDTVTARVATTPDSPFVAQPVRPGRYDLIAEIRNIKTPLWVIPGMDIQPGENRDPRVQPIDLRQTLFRYRLEARTERGMPLPINGPIHARFEQLDGTFVESAFRWRKGKAEMITPNPSAEFTFFGNGYAPMKRHLTPGTHEVLLTTQRPALVNLPGARTLAGPTRKVRISAILKSESDMPTSLRGVDQRTGRSIWFARRDLGRSSGAWLEDSDQVEIPLMMAGKYELLYRPHANESTRSTQASVSLGTFDLTMDGSVTTVSLNAEQILEALNKNDQKWRERSQRSNRRR